MCNKNDIGAESGPALFRIFKLIYNEVVIIMVALSLSVSEGQFYHVSSTLLEQYGRRRYIDTKYIVKAEKYDDQSLLTLAFK